jgi:hypothetical protein
MKFDKADDFTALVFNPNGLHPYDAILTTCTDTNEGYAPYDLTIVECYPTLEYCMTHYRAASGSFLHPYMFRNVGEAEFYIVNWYKANRQKMAVSVEA